MPGGVLVLLCLMAAVLIVLFVGLSVMIKGGKFNEKYGNKLMVARVTLQGLALLVFFLIATTTGGGNG